MIGVGESNGYHYLATELVVGRTLRDVLGDDRFPLATASKSRCRLPPRSPPPTTPALSTAISSPKTS